MVQKRKTANTSLKAPRFPKQPLESVDGEVMLEDGDRFEQVQLAQKDLSQQRAQRVTFDQVLLQHVQLNMTTMYNSHMLDSRLQTCDLANADWRQISLTRVELLECHLTGLQAAEGHIQDVLFKDCQAQFAQFAHTTFKGVRFEDCDLSEVNFYETDLTGAIFLRCNLTSADFSGAKLAGADLRGSKIDGIRVGVRELAGATIDTTQAIAFVRGLGIIVEPPIE